MSFALLFSQNFSTYSLAILLYLLTDNFVESSFLLVNVEDESAYFNIDHKSVTNDNDKFSTDDDINTVEYTSDVCSTDEANNNSSFSLHFSILIIASLNI